MQISNIDVKLNSNDLMSFINDFVKIEGLEIKTLRINNTIEVEGVFKKILALGFKATIEILGVEGDNLEVRFSKAKLMSLGILKPFRKIGLKIALKGFKEQGILVKEDKILINYKNILGKIPFLNLSFRELKIEGEMLKIGVEQIDVELSKVKEPSLEIEVREEIEQEEKTDDYIMSINVEKVEDMYTSSREYVTEHIPEKAQPYKDYIMFIPDIVALIFRLLKDSRVPMKTKMIVGTSIAYVSCPFDIIPDKVPFIGALDDVSVVFFALNRIINDVDINVILENWQGKNEFVVILRKSVDFLSGFTGANNLDNIYEVIDAITN
ncbi:YkvA family protein [Clostridium sp. B9]|uniref:YkvA family protein n=1 Tax=Clostridium sp. B9 TaxID=3423224 RepID=UPI003D2ED42D